MSAVHWSVPLRAALALFCIVCAITLARISLPLENLIGADALVVHKADVLQPAGQRTPTTLPVSWTSSDQEITTRRFFLKIPGELGQVQKSHIYIPFFEQRLRVVVEGATVYDSNDIRFWSGPVGYQSALVALPAHSGLAEPIEILVDTGLVPRGLLSKIYVGPRSAFVTNYRVRSFLEERIKPMLYGAQLLLGIISLGIFRLRPNDRVFGWLGATLLITCIVGNGLLMSYLPALETILRQVYFLAPLLGLALLGFTSSLVGRPVHRFAFLFFIFLTGISVVLTLLPEFAVRQAVIVVSVPALILAVCLSLFLLFLHIRSYADTAVLLFIVGLVIIIYGVSHDLFVRMGYLEDGILIARVSNSLVMAGMAAFLIGKQAETANSLDAAAVTLRARLAKREEELRQIHQRQQELDRQRAIGAERLRITSDLHDGVAGHLATIVALSEAEDDNVEEIGVSAKNALIDLRLVLDALSLPEGSIGFALGSFRERCLQPLERLGIDINWSIIGLPEQMDMSRESILNVLRILQEAVNNAVRHGRPKTLSVSVEGGEPQKVCFVVENAGGVPFSPDDSGSGLGLESMRRRAAAIGGSVRIEPTSDGARVTLIV